MNLSWQGIFEQREPIYRQAMNRYPDARFEEFSKLLQHLPADNLGHIADLPGSGGYLSKYLPSPCNHYTVVDSKSRFSNFCGKQQGRNQLLCPLNKLALADQSQDQLYSLAGMHRIFDRSPVYSEIYRVLKPGAKAVVADVSAGSMIDNFLIQFVRKFNSKGYRALFLDAADTKALRANGLKVLSQVEQSYHWHFDSLKDMADYCQKLFALDLANADEIVAGIDKYLGYQCDRGKVKMNWSLLFITLQRPCLGTVYKRAAE